MKKKKKKKRKEKKSQGLHLHGTDSKTWPNLLPRKS
jgi:hypothetical protein